MQRKCTSTFLTCLVYDKNNVKTLYLPVSERAVYVFPVHRVPASDSVPDFPFAYPFIKALTSHALT